MRIDRSKLYRIFLSCRWIRAEGSQNSCISVQSVWSARAWNTWRNSQVCGEIQLSWKTDFFREGSRQWGQDEGTFWVFKEGSTIQWWNHRYSLEFYKVLDWSYWTTLQEIFSSNITLRAKEWYFCSTWKEGKELVNNITIFKNEFPWDDLLKYTFIHIACAFSLLYWVCTLEWRRRHGRECGERFAPGRFWCILWMSHSVVCYFGIIWYSYSHEFTWKGSRDYTCYHKHVHANMLFGER